jgi:hypothetical protein
MHPDAVHRDHAKHGQGRRAVLQGQAVYRIQRKSTEDWLSGIPADTVRLTAWLKQLANAGIDALWFSSSDDQQSAGWGLCLNQTRDLIVVSSLPNDLRAVAEVALFVGLRVMADIPPPKQKTGPAPKVYTPPLRKHFRYRWMDERHPASTQEQTANDGIDHFRITQYQGWMHQECRAPYAHAELTHSYRIYGRGWPCWQLDAGWLLSKSGEADAAFDPRLLALALALPMCLKGSPLLTDQHFGELCEVPLPISRLLLWRRTIPALRYGKMQMLGMHENLLMFTRQDAGQCVLCVFNLSDRFVRHPLPPSFARFSLIAGSGLEGGRIVNRGIDCNPWGALFAQSYDPMPQNPL